MNFTEIATLNHMELKQKKCMSFAGSPSASALPLKIFSYLPSMAEKASAQQGRVFKEAK